jgi:hypothetical protein
MGPVLYFGMISVGILFGICGTACSYSQLYVKYVPVTRFVSLRI